MTTTRSTSTRQVSSDPSMSAPAVAMSVHRWKHRSKSSWGFLTPYLVLLAVFGALPTLYAIYLSLAERQSSEGAGLFANYSSVFSDFRFWPAVQHMGLFFVIWLPSMVAGVVLLALLLHDRINKFSGAMRLIFFLPAAVTGSASVVLWYFMLQPQLSPFGPALRAMGFEDGSDIFRTGHLPVIFAIMAFMTGAGSWIVIMYGALQNIPEELIEAGRLDGCTRVQLALRVKLPSVRKYVLYMIILSIAAGIQIFVEPQLIYNVTLTAGSPWWSLNQLSYNFAFTNADFGSAATVSVLLLLLSTVAALVLIFFTDFFETEIDS